MICLVLVIAAAAPAANAFDTTDWDWQASVDTQSVPAGFVRLELSPALLDEAQPSLHDLRLVDDSSRLVPFTIHRKRPVEKEPIAWTPVRLINETYVADEYCRATLDFVQHARKNRLRVTLSGRNFRRRVLIEGAQDPADEWDTVLDSGWVFDIDSRIDKAPRGKGYKLDVLEFPVNDFRYLRLTAFNMPDDPPRVHIESAQTVLYKPKQREELISVPAKPISSEWEEETRQTVHEFDLGYRNLPIVKMEVDSTEPYFHRGFELLGRNTLTEPIKRRTETGWDTTERETPWRTIRSGVLHRTQYEDKTTECLTIQRARAPYRYLQLRIHEGDNPPLPVKDFRAYRSTASLVFDNQPPRSYTLTYGNPKAYKPDFDLTLAVRKLSKRELPTASLGPLTPIKHEPQLPPWTERHAYLIWFALAAAVLIMLLLITKNLSHLRQTD